MFGLIMGLIDVAILTHGAIKEALFDSKLKNDFKQRGEVYYIDSHGRYYSTETNEQVTIGRNMKTNHHVVEGIRSGRIYKDYTQENIDQLRKEGKIK